MTWQRYNKNLKQQNSLMIISTRKFGIATQRYLLSEEALLCTRTHTCAQKLTLESKKKRVFILYFAR